VRSIRSWASIRQSHGVSVPLPESGILLVPDHDSHANGPRCRQASILFVFKISSVKYNCKPSSNNFFVNNMNIVTDQHIPPLGPKTSI
jgi:hypothetical protein